MKLLVFALMVCAVYASTYGCLLPPPAPAERVWLDAVADAWTAADMPGDPECLDDVRIVYPVTYALFIAECRGGVAELSTGELTGCTKSVWSQAPWRKGRDYTILIAPGNTHERTTVIHEACHVLRGCASKGVDAAHEDPRVWTELGGADSVQSRSASATE